MSREKQNIKTTDWLTRGMTEAEIAKVKEEAIDEADAELRDKQIEEMKSIIDKAEEEYSEIWNEWFYDHKEGTKIDHEFLFFAKILYDAGYRKVEDDPFRRCTCLALGCDIADDLKRDVAREIFEEIEEVLNMQAKIVCQTRETAREADEPALSWIAMLDGRIYSLRVVEEHIAELKKKYTEVGE